MVTAAGWMPGSMGAQERRIGYAVIGLGEIARHFMPGTKQSQHARVTALVSGHRDKAEKIAAEYGIPTSSIYSYEDFDKIRDNKTVDAVYVALPNNMHAEYTIRAAKAGKHVLCEKPMATSVEDAQRMIEACKTAGVKLMIAYRLQYEPLHLQAIQLIRSGALGRVQSIQSAFGFNSRPGIWRLNKKMAGGGPLVDVGIYCLNATRYLTGEEPASFAAYSSTTDKDGRFAEVEETMVWNTRFPSGILASCTTTYGASMPGSFKVFGANGWIEMTTAFSYDGLRLQAQYGGSGGGAPTSIDKPSAEKDPTQFMREADHLAGCIFAGREPKSSGEEGIRDIRHISAIYEAAGLKL